MEIERGCENCKYRGRNAKGAFYTNIRWTEYALELRGGTMKQYNFDDFKEG